MKNKIELQTKGKELLDVTTFVHGKAVLMSLYRRLAADSVHKNEKNYREESQNLLTMIVVFNWLF